ncbi:rod shape-determining protein MreD, partial [Staphylococcus epidermidis 36-1]
FLKSFIEIILYYFFIILLSTMFLEVYVAMIYGVIGFIKFNLIEFVLLRLIPTLIINFLLLIMLFPIIIKFTKKVKNTIDSKA